MWCPIECCKERIDSEFMPCPARSANCTRPVFPKAKSADIPVLLSSAWSLRVSAVGIHDPRGDLCLV